MDASRRLTSWLRLAGALLLALGLSSATATAATDRRTPVRELIAVAHVTAIATAGPTAATHTGTGIRHAVSKHRLPATASALAATALALTMVASAAVRRRRTDPALLHHSLSHGARAPPAVSG
jgi:hypothetical protein